VLVSARKAEALEHFVQQHPGAQAWPLDVTDEMAVARTARPSWPTGRWTWWSTAPATTRRCGPPTSTGRHAPAHGHQLQRRPEPDDAVLPAMMARGQGHLSLISSVAGFRGLPKSLAYGPTKAALTNLAETSTSTCSRWVSA
jgi:hypothetical protein